MKKKERISSFAHYCWRWLHSRYFIEWLRHIFIAPFGRLRKPVEVKHEKSYNGKYYPVCPHCGNMPYDEDSCYFCGQRFSNRATILEFPEEPIPCTVTFSDGGNLPADEERTEDGRCDPQQPSWPRWPLMLASHLKGVRPCRTSKSR